MSKATPAISAFNAGEWSPLLDGRIDLQGYSASAYRAENFLCTVQGPIVRRGGTRFVNEVEDSTNRSWLVPFIRSRTVAYIIEFADLVCRFYFNRAQVVSGMAAYEIASPYSAADMVNSAGEFNLDFVQSGDVLYITHRSGDFLPRKLSRTSSTSWAFSTMNPTTGPWDGINGTSTTIYASAATGTVTLTASTSIFTADDVGSLIRLDQLHVDTAPWEASEAYTTGDFVRSAGNEYEAATTATSGTTIPSHSQGTVSDGGVEWTFRSAGFGWGRITAQSGTTATVDVLRRFPQTVVGPGNPTTLWRRGAWSARSGYPQTVAFFNERLCFGMGQRIDMSTVAGYEDFSIETAGEITAESAVSVTIQSSQVNDIMSLVEGDGLIVNTEGGEFTVGSLTTSEPFGPGNIKVLPCSAYGSRPIRALRVGEATLFVQASGRKLREAIFDIQVNNLVARDLAIRAEHITAPRVTSLARQEEPYQLVWLVRSDGQLAVLTYDRTQEVRGWSRQIIGGAFGEGIAVVESAAVIPSPDGARDDLWLIVKRTIDGSTVRYIEYMEAPWDTSQDADEAFYVDSGLTYDGAPATTISGLDHLEGQSVAILADGARHPTAVVTGGEITLTRAASVVHVGLPFRALWATNRIEAGANDGTAQTKTKRLTDVSFRVLNTLGGKAGPDLDTLDDIPDLTYRWAGTPMGQAGAFYSGDAHVDWPGGYELAGRIWYVNDEPFPAVLILAAPQVVTQEAR